VLQHAETAMREAKRRGGRAYHFYSEALNGSLERRLGLDRMLRHAIENGELSVLYQPIVELGSGRVVAAEALLRWMHPVLGAVPPTEFVPLAESTGLMRELGEWVLRKSCRQLRTWLDEGARPLRMAVNISRCQLEDGDLAETVRSVLLETQIDPALLELELSERGVLRQDKDVMKQVQRLKALGVRLVVDDFGTGDTMIAYLGQLPLDGLKIDQSFVGNLVNGEDEGVLTSAIVALAHRLKLSVTAEGVEQESQPDPARLRLRGSAGFPFSPAVAGGVPAPNGDRCAGTRPDGPGRIVKRAFMHVQRELEMRIGVGVLVALLGWARRGARRAPAGRSVPPQVRMSCRAATRAAEAAVASVGGVVTHRLAIINGVGACWTRSDRSPAARAGPERVRGRALALSGEIGRPSASASLVGGPAPRGRHHGRG
jgi:EAL domain-containing protein (putative c-di-GMP-specific phosphodiesterase class I)